MPNWKQHIRERLAGLKLDPRREAEIVEEVAQHLADTYSEARAAGASETESAARALAELETGGVLERELARLELREREPTALGREGRGNIVADFWQDARYAFRMMTKNPGVTLVIVLTLALGIGANTAIFSVVHAVLLQPLPFEDPQRIVTVWENNLRDGIPRDDVSPANFLDWQERQRVFQQMAFSNPWSLDLVGGEEPETVQSALVSEGFFRILGVQPLMGRTFLPEEFQPGRNQVVVMTYGFWQRKFGGDPSVVGRVLTLGGDPYTVVGILPADFELRLHEREREMFAPQLFAEEFRQQRRATYLKVIARLKPGITLEQAQAAMATIAGNLARELPRTNEGVGVTVVPLREHLVGRVRPALWVLLGAVGFVLLIACVNVANLLLAQASHREREFAVREALGAGRGRLVRQLLAENLLLVLLGAGGGLLLAPWGLRGIVAISPGELPRAEGITVNSAVLTFTAALALLAVLAAGLAPALQFLRFNVQHTLRESGRTATASSLRQRLRSALVVAEVALALILLVGAGLLLRSFRTLLRVDPGFARNHTVVLQTFLWARYHTPEQRRAYVREAVARIRRMPGVISAGATTAVPFLGSSKDSSFPITVEGQPALPPGQEPTAFLTTATPGFFETLGVPLLRGRLLNEFDTADAPPVAVISDLLARRFWPKGDAVGKKFTVSFGSQSRSGARPVTLEVVGVVGSTRHESLNAPPRAEFFLPHTQSPSGSMIFVARTAGDPSVLLPTLKNALWELNRAQPFYAVSTMDDLIAGSLAARRFNLFLLGAFAGLAVALAAIGIYGVMAYSVSLRTHEIGVRMALGAQRFHVFRLVLGQGMLTTLAGLGIGVLGALGLTRFLGSLLYGVQPTDLTTFAMVSAFLAAVALAACWIPARRAAKVDPMVALRYE